MNRSLVDMASELELITSQQLLWSSIVDVLRNEGFDFVIYLTVDSDFQNPVLLSTNAAIYGDVDPATDPFLEYCCHSYTPTLTGAAFLPRYDYLPEAARAFILRAQKEGFESGLAIPVRLAGSTRFGGFNIGTGLDAETFEQRYSEKISLLRMFSLLMHRRLEELESDQHVFENGFRRMMISDGGGTGTASTLTEREKEVLFLLANGMSRKECARSCGLSPHTVSDYTKSIYRKLGVHSLVEAARAAQLI